MRARPVFLLFPLLIATGATLRPTPPAETVAIRAGKILTLTGPPIASGVVLIRGGKIVAAGSGVAVPPAATVIDASSRVVMPGLVAAFSTLAEQTDAEEAIAPDVRAADAVDLYASTRRLLQGGVTTAYVATGQRRLLSGQGAVVKLAGGPSTGGRPAATRVLRASADVRLMLGEAPKGPPALFRPPIPPTAENPILPAQGQFPSARPAEFAVLRQLFADARKAAGGPVAATDRGRAVPGDPHRLLGNSAALPAARDPRLAVLIPVLRGETPLRVNAHTAADIEKALQFAEEQQVRVILEGATEGYRVAEEIARRGAPVVVQVRMRLGRPMSEDLTRDVANGVADAGSVARLVRAGVRVALVGPEDEDLPELRLLAACQVPQGLSPEAALRTVTADAAEILGVAGRVGTIAAGKDADLLILSGDPLDARSRVEMTLVEGRVVYERRDDAAAGRGEAAAGTGRIGTAPSRSPLSRPARTPGRTVAIRAGKILTVTRGEVTRGVILIRDGKIAAVTREPLIPPGVEVIDVSRGVVMPGLIDSHSHLGLHAEAEPAPLEPPAATTGANSARTRLTHAVDPFDPAFGEALRAGVTAILLAPPTRGQVCGQAALLKTAPCPLHVFLCEERLLRDAAALCFSMPAVTPRMAQPWSFRDLLQRAKDYHRRRAQYERDSREWERERQEAAAQGKDAPKEPAEVARDEDLEPFAALFRREIPALVHAGRADEIANGLKVFRDEFDLDVALVDAGDGFRVADEIQRRGAAAALGPAVMQRDRGQSINNAEVLARQGVRLLFHSSATSATQFLRLNAAYAVGQGLDPAEALRALTISPARVFGVEKRLGSIEVGKDADLVILNGDPWDLTTRVQKVLVNGKVVYDGS